MIIPVKTETSSYDIVLERGALAFAKKYLHLERKVLVVTDSGVPSEYTDRIVSECAEAVRVCFPEGEQSKNLDTFSHLLSVMIENNFTRGDCVVAVGGGVVGDISGFAASCYMRGIDFYNIPTTLLSQVDSSIGGKTAVDFKGVKNSVGTFYHPKKVIIDPNVLDTLDERQLHSGLAEIIKAAAIYDAELFSAVENTDNLKDALEKIIYRSLCIKKDVVEQDPHETGLRRVLNFGHTIGHAVEACSQGKMLHGECVAVGMIPMCGEEVRKRIKAVLKKYSLPTKSPFTSEELMPYILHDKKKTSSGINIVYVDRIGSFEIKNMSAFEIKALTEIIL